MTYRALITGSRMWRREQPVRDAIAAIVSQHGPQNVVIVEGCAPGADQIAERIGVAWGGGLTVEHHPADWDTCAPACRSGHRRARRDGTTYCPAAGLRRDAEMVAQGADVCLAFIAPCADRTCRRRTPHGSHGASYTADRAHRAGIPVRRWTA